MSSPKPETETVMLPGEDMLEKLIRYIGHAGLQPWGLGLHPPYLGWLFHTLVEEVERTGPLHPEGKGRPGCAHGGTGEGGKGDRGGVGEGG